MTGRDFDRMQMEAQKRVDNMKSRADEYISRTNSRMGVHQGENVWEKSEYTHGGGIKDEKHGFDKNESIQPMIYYADGRAGIHKKENEYSEQRPLNFLQEFLHNDRLIILAVIAALWGEKSDDILMLALLYVLL